MSGISPGYQTHQVGDDEHTQRVLGRTSTHGDPTLYPIGAEADKPSVEGLMTSDEKLMQRAAHWLHAHEGNSPIVRDLRERLERLASEAAPARSFHVADGQRHRELAAEGQAAPAAQPATPLREVLGDERAKFEGWANDNHLDTHLATDGDYFDAQTAATWFAWKASSDRDRDMLEQALERMDRARRILTDNNPRPECNWGLLDTSDIRAALRSRLDGEKT